MTDYTKLAEDSYALEATPGLCDDLARALLKCDRERRRAIDAAMAERLKRREAEALTQDYRNALEYVQRERERLILAAFSHIATRVDRALAAGQPQEWGGNVDAENDALAAGDKT